MNRFIGAVLLVLAASCAAGETVLVGDFCAVGIGGDAALQFSTGLPYFIARALNGAGGCQAILPSIPPSRFVARCYEGSGAPRLGEAGLLCAASGADRCLLARAAARSGGGFAVTFYVFAPGARAPEAFRSDVAGGAECAAALAAHAASKICPGSSGLRAPRIPAGFLGPFSRALRSLREGDMKDALHEAQELSREWPENADACRLSGLVAREQRKPYLALSLFTEAGNLDARFALPAYEEGEAWLSLDRSTLAEKAFERAIRIQPSFFDAAVELGALRAGRGDYAGASAALGGALLLRPRDTRARTLKATCLAAEGKTREAKALLERLAEEQPRYAPGRFLFGKVLYQSGDFAGAERELRAAAALAPADPEAHRLLGEALSRQGGYNRHAEAVEEFRKALLLERKK